MQSSLHFGSLRGFAPPAIAFTEQRSTIELQRPSHRERLIKSFPTKTVRARPSKCAMYFTHQRLLLRKVNTLRLRHAKRGYLRSGLILHSAKNQKTSRSSITTKVASKEREVMVQLRSPQEKRDLPRSHPHSITPLKVMALWSAPRFDYAQRKRYKSCRDPCPAKLQRSGNSQTTLLVEIS